jgi:signal transduction histidine kinase
MNSIARRLHVGLALSLLILILALGILLHLVLAEFGRQFSASRLDHDAETLLATLTFQADGSARVQGLGPVYQRPFSGHYYTILMDDIPILRSRSLWDSHLPSVPLAHGHSEVIETAGPNGQNLLLWRGGFRKQGRDLTVIVAEDLSPLADSLAGFRRYYALLGVLALIFMLVLQHLVVRRSLQSLERVRADIRRLERGEVECLGEYAPTEILPLVREINHLLRQLGQRLQRSRNALGNLAHALKTPLTLLQQLRQHPDMPPELAQTLAAHTGELQRRIDGELKRARLAGKAAPGALFDPAQEIPVLFKVLRQLHRDKDLRLHHALQANLRLAVDRQDMLELLGNLLDNACQWARCDVSCEIQADKQNVRIIVRDDGAGVAASDLDSLSQRGARLDESRPGHGLGLAIVAEIVRLYAGRLEFDSLPDKGLSVLIFLPAALADSKHSIHRKTAHT